MIKEIEGYEGRYAITDDGQVYSYFKKGYMIPKIDKDGYLQIGLRKGGKQKWFLVHRLVAMAYIPNPLGLPEINHKDEVKDNNNVGNLEWCSRIYNHYYGTGIKRSSEGHRKPIKCLETGIEYTCAQEVEEKTGIKTQCVSKCCRGQQKTAGKLHWAYI